MRKMFSNLVFSAVFPLAIAASLVDANDYNYVSGQRVSVDITGPVALARPWATLETVEDPLRRLTARASGVEFQPEADVVGDILTQMKKYANNESLVDYDCKLDILHMEHALKFEGTLKTEGGDGSGEPPKWALVGIDLMDLAIDSDNNNQYDEPDMKKEEYDKEEDEPGKIFLVNDDDLDYDDIPDFADGFSAWNDSDYASVTPSDPDEKLPLVPVILEVRVSGANSVVPGSVKIKFDYTMSDPDPAKGDLKREKVGETDDGKPMYEYSAKPGFRLWLSNAASRKKKSVKDGGDFVPVSSGSQIDDAEFTLSDLRAANSGTVRIKLYLEATPGAEELKDQFITATVTAKLKTKAGETREISQSDKVRVNPIRMQFVTRGENDDDIVPTKFVGVCTPRPEVKLVDARKYDIKINKAGGYATLTLKCDEILDPVADNLPEGVGEIKNVEIIVDGGDSQAASGAPVPVKAVDAGPPSFWKQHPYKGKFSDTTVKIPLEEGTHTVEVRSGENAAGLIGFDEVSVTLTKEVTYIPGTPGTTVVANIYLPEEPTDGKKDKLRYYFGRRKVKEDDPVFAERRRKSLKFHGELEGLAAKVAVTGFNGLTDKKDSFTAKVPVVVAAANKKKILYLTAAFKETKKKSNLFRATITYGATPGRTRTKWKVAKVENSIGSGKGSYMPFTIRIKGLPEGYVKNALLTWDTKGSKLTENHFAPNDGWLYPLSASELIAYAIDENGDIWAVRLETDGNGNPVMENGKPKFIKERVNNKDKITGKFKLDKDLVEWLKGKNLTILGVVLIQRNFPDSKTSTDVGKYIQKVISDSPNENIAYITGEPAQPKLEAILQGGTAKMTVSWKLKIKSERAERLKWKLDNKIYPKNGKFRILKGNVPWNIFTEFQGDFVGGDCTLIYKINNGAENTFNFKIRGKNPLDATALKFIKKHQGVFRYYWAIIREESLVNGSSYNQFNPSNTGKFKELPNKGRGGGDGWGMAMIDRSGSKPRGFTTTDEVYNWKINVLHGMAILRQKEIETNTFFNSVRRTYPNDPVAANPPAKYIIKGTKTPFSARELSTLILYNGSKGTQKSRLKNKFGEWHYVKNPWKYNPITKKWTFKDNDNDYGYKVIYNHFEGHLKIKE